MKENAIREKSTKFAVRMIRLYQHLADQKREFVLSKQLLRSGTSIGANVREAERAQSKKDFIPKMNIALKEAAESEFEKYRIVQDRLYQSDFDKQIQAIRENSCSFVVQQEKAGNV